MTSVWQLVATIVAQVLVAAFVYGQLTQKVKDLTSWSKEHNEQLRDHARQLMDHEGRISRLQGEKER